MSRKANTADQIFSVRVVSPLYLRLRRRVELTAYDSYAYFTHLDVISLVCPRVRTARLWQRGFGRFFIEQNDPPPTEFVIARWKFSTNGRIGNMGWSHNYPNAEIHLNQLLSEVTAVNVESLSIAL